MTGRRVWLRYADDPTPFDLAWQETRDQAWHDLGYRPTGRIRFTLNLRWRRR